MRLSWLSVSTVYTTFRQILLKKNLILYVTVCISVILQPSFLNLLCRYCVCFEVCFERECCRIVSHSWLFGSWFHNRCPGTLNLESWAFLRAITSCWQELIQLSDITQNYKQHSLFANTTVFA